MALRLINPRFELGAVGADQFPPRDAAEFVIAGRSNVGKSSLLNALFGTKKLVKTSKAPGRTRELNFFSAELVDDKDLRVPVRFVDLPGYGYARVSHSQRDLMSERIQAYLEARRHCMALLLLDLKRPPSDLDKQAFDFLCDMGPAQVVCTKTDRLNASGKKTRRRDLRIEMGLHAPPLLTSASKGLGLNELLKRIGRWAETPIEPGEPQGL